MKNKNYLWGVILVVIGVSGILNRIFHINLFSIGFWWPVFVLIPGVAFEIAYFTTRKNPGVLVPGGILTTIGLLFLFQNFTFWRFSAYTWPIYLLAVAVGLFQLYWFGGKQKALLIPVGIIIVLVTIFFASIIVGNVFSILRRSIIIPILLLVVGLYIIFRKGNRSNS